MLVLAEQCVQASEHEAAGALPPVRRKPCSKVTNCFMIKLVAVPKQERALVLGQNFAAFMRCLEVYRHCAELRKAVFREERALNVLFAFC